MKKIFTMLILAVGLMTSCQDYLDINKSPNSPSAENMTPDMMFPAVEMNLAASYGDFLRIVGGYYSQHYSQLTGTSNYLDYSQFNMSATRSSGTYTQLNTRVLGNLKTIRDYAAANEEWGTYLAATVLRAFTYQVLVDCYEQVPYTEAMNTAYPSPKYDDGLTVYQGVIAEIDDALAKASESDLVCNNFLFPSAGAQEWVRFANALKLKMYMRISGVADVQSAVDALVSEGNFPTSDVAWMGCWTDEGGKANPYFSEEFGSYTSVQKNVSLNLALQGTMSSYNDARLAAFFDPSSNGNYTGAISGTNFSVSASDHGAGYWCRPAVRFNSPVYLITVSEVEFFLAEYYAKKDPSKAEAHYKAAVDASFASAGVTGADAVYGSGAAYAWDASAYKEVIGVQKWVALSGTNNFEAWCELRRLGYPAFSGQKGDDFYNVQSGDYDATTYIPGTLYTPITVNAILGAGKVLQRFPFADSSSSRNENVPEYKGDGAPMFWVK